MKTVALTLIFGLAFLNGCNSNPEKEVLTNRATQVIDTEQQWYCQGDNNGQWRCSDLSQARISTVIHSEPQRPVPVATEASNSLTGEPIISAKNTTAHTTKTSNIVKDATTSDYPQLLQQPGSYYAVQLIAAYQIQTIDDFRQQYPQLITQQVNIRRDGRPWHLLLLGIYPSYSSAQNAIREISHAINDAPWIRPLGPLQESLRMLSAP
jgi:septal ring-binding cell division protein DamX